MTIACAVDTSHRPWMQRLASPLIGLATVVVLTGCSVSGIKFTNVSDAWLNVQFYVGTTDTATEGTNDLYHQRAIQIEPGQSAMYRPPRNLVHIGVETVSPTWVPTGQQYWLELLTQPPMHVVAGGREDKLDFKSFQGEVAIIPERERDSGRFVYHSTSEPVEVVEETPPVVTEATPEDAWEE